MKSLKIASAIAAVAVSVLLTMNYANTRVLAQPPSDTSVHVNERNFPDENFRNYVSQYAGNDGMITAAARDAVTEMRISGKSIGDLTGIQYFENLTFLDCSRNQISFLDVSQNTKLKTLYCTNNELTELNVSKNTALQSLECSRNKITSLDVSKNVNLTILQCDSYSDLQPVDRLSSLNVKGAKALSSLSCQYNSFTSLDLSGNAELTYVNISRGGYVNNDTHALAKLDLSANTKLKTLKCENLSLSSLNVSTNTALEELSCGGNNITQINLSALTSLKKFFLSYSPKCTSIVWPTDKSQLTRVYVVNSPFTKLDVSGMTGLTQLECYNNTKMTSLVVSGCTALKQMKVYDNKLTSLNTSGLTSLEDLQCQGNAITALNLSGNTNLTNLECGGNQFETLNLSGLSKLRTLACSQGAYGNTGKKIKTLNVTGANSLYKVICNANEISALDLSGKDNLYWLECCNNKIQKLNLTSCSSLTLVHCYFNELTSLDLSDCVKLENLQCSSNSLTTLKLPATTETMTITCTENQLKELDTSMAQKLYFLACGSNQLEKLTVYKSNALTELYCQKNKIAKLDLAGCTRLKELNCEKNKLTSLTLTGDTKLQRIYCSENLLTSLDISDMTVLTVLECDGNKLKTLDLSSASALVELECQVNALTSLNVSSSTALKKLTCYGNSIKTINVDACPNLKAVVEGDFDRFSYPYNFSDTYYDVLRFPANYTGSSAGMILCDASTAIQAAGLTPTPTPFPTPANFKAVELTNMSKPAVKISWDPVPGATQYRITHTDPIDGHWYGYTIITETSYMYSYEVFPDTTYSYEVSVYPEDRRFPNPVSVISITTQPDKIQPLTDITVKLGDTYRYEVHNIPSEYLTFKVGNTSVATVDEQGNITAKSLGNTYLYVGLPNGKTIKCLVRVTYPELKIRYTEKTLYPCQTFAFTVTGATGQKITWSVGNTAVATVDASGKVTAKKIANTYLYAKSADGRSAKCLLKVVDPGELGINYTEKTIFLGQSFTFTAKNARVFTPTWSVGNTAVAKVDSASGKVTPVSVGNTYLYVKTSDGRSARCLVKVVDPGPLNIRYSEKTIKVGSSFKFTATNTAGQTVSWRVGNSAVATVDASGNVTGKSVANTYLYAKTPDGREVRCLLKIVA